MKKIKDLSGLGKPLVMIWESDFDPCLIDLLLVFICISGTNIT